MLLLLYLKYTNIPENTPEDKQITRSLYGGNNETRIQQEIVLGVGGIRALHAIGIKPVDRAQNNNGRDNNPGHYFPPFLEGCFR